LEEALEKELWESLKSQLLYDPELRQVSDLRGPKEVVGKCPVDEWKLSEISVERN
jgi:hypothetical protein